MILMVFQASQTNNTVYNWVAPSRNTMQPAARKHHPRPASQVRSGRSAPTTLYQEVELPWRSRKWTVKVLYKNRNQIFWRHNS